ncbi:MAG: PIN domain-containing protein [Chthoniobacterales bacterium]
MPTLIDSSLWTHQLRRSGDPGKRARVEALLVSGEAAWCPPVRLELWRGVTSDSERKALRAYEASIPDFPIGPEVWKSAIQLADKGRAAGLTFPLADLLIYSCARFHRLELAHADTHFEQMMSLNL